MGGLWLCGMSEVKHRDPETSWCWGVVGIGIMGNTGGSLKEQGDVKSNMSKTSPSISSKYQINGFPFYSQKFPAWGFPW